MNIPVQTIVKWQTYDIDEIVRKTIHMLLATSPRADVSKLGDTPTFSNIVKWLWHCTFLMNSQWSTIQRLSSLSSMGIITFSWSNFKDSNYKSNDVLDHLQDQMNIRHKGIDDDLADILDI